MRDPQRIPKILARLAHLWQQHPQLRLAQLIGNVFHRERDPYHLEDESFIAELEKYYSSRKV